MELITLEQFILGIVLVIILAGLIGAERESQDKPISLRATILVALGSTVITATALALPSLYPQAAPVDISRIIGQIVVGIGFLGAGAIIRSRGEVHGLTTAVTIWIVAALGMMVGIGWYIPALLVTFITILILVALSKVEESKFIHNNKGNK